MTENRVAITLALVTPVDHPIPGQVVVDLLAECPQFRPTLPQARQAAGRRPLIGWRHQASAP